MDDAMVNPPASGATPAWWATSLPAVAPGLGLAAAIAILAYLAAPLVNRAIPIPALVIALIIGIALNPLAARRRLQPGIAFAIRTLLRCAVALLGLRISLADIAALGWGTALLVIVSMALTIVSGFLFARLLGQTACYGALAGAGTAVCGASATLATATVLPDYPGKHADVVFVVVAVNTLSTVAMVLYPPFCAWLGLNGPLTGVLLGATIHDVAQVVGAGYGVSELVGNAAVIVKLFRVFLLFPVVVAIGWQFARASADGLKAKVPFPTFALVFVALCVVNSIATSLPPLAPAYRLIKPPLVEAANWGLLIAIAALGLSTSLKAITSLGWRHIATAAGTTLVILVVVTAGLFMLS
jgi:uncharacterized integral membrane protein (TIGR00698 family)